MIAPATPPADGALRFEAEHLEALQNMRRLESYYRWVFDLLRPHMGRRILDAGCGVGNFTALAADVAETVVAGDLSPANLAVLRQRFADRPNVQPLPLDLAGALDHLAQYRLDTVVCLDVLEHVDDDVGLLRRFSELVGEGGRLLLKVPACPWMFGSIDIASDHRRRYTADELCRKARAAGWRPITAHYMNIAGVLPYWLKSRVLRRQANFSRTFKPWQLSLIRTAVPLLRILDAITGPFVGQSAILVAEVA